LGGTVAGGGEDLKFNVFAYFCACVPLNRSHEFAGDEHSSFLLFLSIMNIFEVLVAGVLRKKSFSSEDSRKLVERIKVKVGTSQFLMNLREK
jgi:hypothetical protein